MAEKALYDLVLSAFSTSHLDILTIFYIYPQLHGFLDYFFYMPKWVLSHFLCIFYSLCLECSPSQTNTWLDLSLHSILCSKVSCEPLCQRVPWSLFSVSLQFSNLKSFVVLFCLRAFTSMTLYDVPFPVKSKLVIHKAKDFVSFHLFVPSTQAKVYHIADSQ